MVWDDSETCSLGYLALFCILSNSYEIYLKHEFHLYDKKYHVDVLIISSLITFYHETKTYGTTEESFYFIFIYLKSNILKIKTQI